MNLDIVESTKDIDVNTVSIFMAVMTIFLTIAQGHILTSEGLSNLRRASQSVEIIDSNHAIIKTSAAGLLCGIYALQHSLEHQLPDIPRPSAAVVIEIASSPTIHARISETRLAEDFSCNFSVDQVAAILQQYG